MFGLSEECIGDLNFTTFARLRVSKNIKNIEPDKNGEIQITDALLTQAKQGKVIAYKFKGKRFDCGGIKGYVEATNYFAKQQRVV